MYLGSSLTVGEKVLLDARVIGYIAADARDGGEHAGDTADPPADNLDNLGRARLLPAWMSVELKVVLLPSTIGHRINAPTTRDLYLCA
jgi:hypothetical protein